MLGPLRHFRGLHIIRVFLVIVFVICIVTLRIIFVLEALVIIPVLFNVRLVFCCFLKHGVKGVNFGVQLVTRLPLKLRICRRVISFLLFVLANGFFQHLDVAAIVIVLLRAWLPLNLLVLSLFDTLKVFF